MMMSDFESRLAGSGLDLKTYVQYMGMDLDSFKKNYEPEAQKQVKTRLALEKVASLEGIVVADEDIEKEYQTIADAYKMPLEQVKMYIPATELSMDVAVGKAVELIKNNAEITEEKVSSRKKSTTTKKASEKKEEEAK